MWRLPHSLQGLQKFRCITCHPADSCHAFMQADDALAASTGNAFAPDPAQHDWMYGMEPVTGLTLYVSCPLATLPAPLSPSAAGATAPL